ncbi:hypothetical protein BU23DRAFT_603560 [Bimuria novae-zelandiae CBS 107.79]|uniref:DUF7907 domain-containing protein n=1 Tax=Bimuria novae-zelandiae CBS 107.79 TaxID=1447943 RepID=A0A6A5URN6_9PLEO|nr:hypothetical protein BU23DRAFT_603560 [Bimuria novae-zelandiae CBS 107.79]
MKSTFVLAAFASGALAQIYNQSSVPFRLFLKSDNETLNGQSLGACHQGAAIEGLCPSGHTREDGAEDYNTFYQQTALEPVYNLPDNDTYGPLVWNLTVNGGEIVPSYMTMDPYIDSNIVNPTFGPGNSSFTSVAFTAGGCMYNPVWLDDTVSPPVFLDEAKKVENWYTCLTRTNYLYVTLSWKIGLTGEPQNPSCERALVIREFVE